MSYDTKLVEELELEIWKLKGRVERLENQAGYEEKKGGESDN